MKKLICLLFAVIIAIGAAGCSGNSAENKTSKSNGQGVADILSSAAETQPTTVGSVTVPQTTAAAANIKYPELDYEAEVDLTALNSNMVYSEVAAMVSTPEKYIGKTVKMKGPFAVYHDETTDNYYFACVIRDATACCAQGIEFELADKRTYPDDYPEIDEEICVVGVFDTYKEGEYTYCTLRNAKLL